MLRPESACRYASWRCSSSDSAADKGRAGAVRQSCESDQAPHGLSPEPLEFHVPQGGEVSPFSNDLVASRADKDLPGLGKLLEARRKIHAGADTRLVALGFRAREIDDCFPRLDADPHRQRNRRRAARLGPSNAGQCGPKSPLRIIGMGNRHPEQCENGIADERPDAAAFGLDNGLQRKESLIERALEPFGPQLHDQRG